MAEEDTSKTAFRCPGFVGWFEWVVMTSGLKTAGATYQRAMNLSFHDLHGVILEVYIDNIVFKSAGLNRDLVEHRLPIKAGFRPYKQPVRHFNPIIYDRIKTEINRLLDAGFIRSCRYADWISNIVPVEKKDSGKIRVCVDFRDLNKVLPRMNILCL